MLDVAADNAGLTPTARALEETQLVLTVGSGRSPVSRFDQAAAVAKILAESDYVADVYQRPVSEAKRRWAQPRLAFWLRSLLGNRGKQQRRPPR